MVSVITRTHATNNAPQPQRTGLRSQKQSWQPRNRGRAAIGAFFVGISMLIVFIAYQGSGNRTPVLTIVRDVPAGTQLSASDVGVARVSVDASLPTMPESQRGNVVGQYAKTRLLRGSILNPGALQSSSLLDKNNAVIAVQLSRGSLPTGLRELSRVWLVLTASGGANSTVVAATVAALPDELASSDAVSLSLEVALDDAPKVATADKVAVLLIDPLADTAPPAAVAEVTP